ncbi:MAG: HYR domain-containing protein, partial [Flavobacteriales bacterium]
MNLNFTFRSVLVAISLPIALIFSLEATSQLNVNENASNAAMSNLIQGNGVVISNFTVTSGANEQVSSFTNTAAAGNPIDLVNGLLLSTGRGNTAVGPNNTGSQSRNNGFTYNDPDITAIVPNATFDVVVVEFDVVPLCDTMQLSFVFGSDEYAEYTCADFNDAFAFFVSGPGISGPYTNGAENFAQLPDGTPVSIGTVNQGFAGSEGDPVNCSSFANTAYYINNTGNAFIQADGLTTQLRVKGVVQPCQTYHVKCVLADAGDAIYDSWVWLDGFTCEGQTVDIFPTTSGGSAVEGCGSLTYNATRGGDINVPLTVSIAYTGTATYGVDYNNLPTVLNFAAGQDVIPFTIFPVDDGITEGTETMILTATYGVCSTSYSQVFTFDIEEPELILDCSPLVFNTGPGTCEAVVTFADPTATTNCGNVTVTRTDGTGINSGDVLTPGTYTLSYSATTDGAVPLSETCNRTISVVDNQLPVFTCPSNISQNAAGACSATVTIPVPTATDNCGPVTITNSYTGTSNASGVYYGGTTNVVWTATDVNGNVTTCVQTVTLTNTASGTAYGMVVPPTQGCAYISAPAIFGTLNNISWDGTDLTKTGTNSLTNSDAYSTNAVYDNGYVYAVTPNAQQKFLGLSANNDGPNGWNGIDYAIYTRNNNTLRVYENGTLMVSNAGSYSAGDTLKILRDNGVVRYYRNSTLLYTSGQTPSAGPYYVDCTIETNGSKWLDITVVNPSCGTFQAGALGYAGPYTYQWLRNGSVISGATSQTYNAPSLTVGDSYSVLVSSATCTLNSNELLVLSNSSVSCTNAAYTFTAAGVDCSANGVVPNPAIIGNCPAITITNDFNGGTSNANGVYNIGTTLVTFTLTTNCGETLGTCTATVNVVDNIAPTISCPGNTTYNYSSGCTNILPDFTSTITATDNCTGSPVTITQSPIAGSLVSGTVTVTITATDDNFNSSTCTFNATAADNEGPTFTCPSDGIVSIDPNTCTAIIPNYVSGITFTDNCTPSGSIVTSQSPSVGSTISSATVITITATDASGNVTTCTFNVTPADVTPPVLTCPGDITVDVDSGSCDAVVTYAAVTATEPCAVSCPTTISGFSYIGELNGHVYFLSNNTTNYNNAISNCISAGGYLVAISSAAENLLLENYIDAANVDAWIGFNDIASEGNFVWTNGEPVVYTNWQGGQPNNNGGSGAADGVRMEQDGGWDDRGVNSNQRYILEIECGASDPIPTLTSGLASGSTFPLGTTTVVYSATDDNGNTGTCSFNVTVQDLVAPVITCSGDVTVNVDSGTCGAALTFDDVQDLGTPSSTSSCVAIPTSSGCTGGNGAATNNLTVSSGQYYWYTSTGTFTNFTMNGGTLVVCGSLTLSNITFNSGTIYVENGGSLTINGGGTINFNGNCNLINRGTLTINRSITMQNTNNRIANASSTAVFNMNNGNYTLTINSSTSPFTNLGTATIRNLTVQAGTAPGLFCLGSGSSLSVNTLTNNTTNSFAANDGEACIRIITSATLNNALSNTSNLNACIATGATIGGGGGYGSATVSTNCAACPAPFGASDNCAIVSIVNDFNGTNNASGTYPVGTTTVVWTATDSYGNTATCSQDITVVDNISPTISCPSAQTLNLGAGCQAVLPDYSTLASISDNCGAVASITQTPIAGTVYTNATVITVTITATDASGNSNTCNFNVTIQDATAPVAICPSDIDVDNDPGLCGAVVNYTISATDNCGSIDCAPTFITGYTYIDELNGHKYFRSNSNTTWSNANDAANALGGHLVTISSATENTLLSGIGAHWSGFTDEAVEGTWVWVTGEPVTYTNWNPGEPNNSGNQDYGVLNYSADRWDDQAGTTNLPYIVEFDCSVNLISGIESGEIFPVGTTTVTYTVTDSNGNVSAPCSFDVTVNDNENPTINCLNDIEVDNDAGLCSAIVNYILPTAIDNCPECTTPPTIAGYTSLGSYNGTAYYASNVAQNFTAASTSASATGGYIATISSQAENDFIRAAFTSVYGGSSYWIGLTDSAVEGTFEWMNGQPITYTNWNGGEPNNSGGNEDNVEVLASGLWNDQNGGSNLRSILELPCVSVSVTSGLPSGSAFPVGVTTVVLTAEDSFGNTSDCTFDVTVIDSENPQITCPSGLTISNNSGSCFATTPILPNPTTNDNCGVLSVTNDAPATLPVGVNSITYTVTDIYGNISTCNQSITVVDTEDPVITCPANISVSNDAGVCGAVVTFSVTSSDNCAGEVVTQTGGLASGSTFPIGTTSNTFLVTDASGNTATCSFTVTVADTEDPVITCPANISVNNDAGVCGAVVTFSVTSSDNCAGEVVTQTGGLASGSTFPIGTTTNTFLVTDASGNTATCSFTVAVADTEDPVITCPANISVSNDAGVCGAVVTFSVTSSDNCAGEVVTQTGGLASGSTFPIGTTTNTFLVTDASGNTATCSFTVTVADTEDPVITCPANISVSNDAGVCGAVVTFSITSSDNCAGEVVTQTGGLASGSTFPIGTTTNSFLVTDASGNTATCSFTVTVADTEDPVITCPANISVSNDAGVCGA